MNDNYMCCKCNSNKVVKVEDVVGWCHIFISKFKSVPTCRLVCCECGYIEERWVSNKNDLEIIYNKYK